MEAKRVLRKLRIARQDSIQYQILTELFLRKVYLNQSDIELMTLLGLWGPIDLNQFCEQAAEIVYKDTPKVIARVQNVRNRLVLLEKKNLVLKTLAGKKKKTLSLAEGFDVEKTGNILLDYNFLSIDTH
jgi:hypothetical protein